MRTEGQKATKKRRVYQVAREFHISNEALLEFLQEHEFKLRNHMAPVTDVMYDLVCQNFMKEEEVASREPDYKKRILEKKVEEEARREAIRHEIDELLERSKVDEFEPVEIVERTIEVKKPKKSKKAEKKTEPEPVLSEEELAETAVQEAESGKGIKRGKGRKRSKEVTTEVEAVVDEVKESKVDEFNDGFWQRCKMISSEVKSLQVCEFADLVGEY